MDPSQQLTDVADRTTNEIKDLEFDSGVKCGSTVSRETVNTDCRHWVTSKFVASCETHGRDDNHRITFDSVEDELGIPMLERSQAAGEEVINQRLPIR